MARKKGRRKKRGPSLYTSLAAFSGAAALFLASFLYLALSSRFTPPPFEEIISPATSSLNRQITKIDQAIYRYLREVKVPQRNIAFLGVRPEHGNMREWEFAELLIRVPRQGLVSSFEKGLKLILSSHEPPVRIRSEEGPQGERVIHIHAGSHYTHRIRIRPETQASVHPENKPRIALIIDDLGYDLDSAKSLLDLQLALNLAVLPKAPFTKKIAEAAQRKRCEVILHLPMEPENHPNVDAGPGALLTRMSEHEIRALLEEHLQVVPGARGVNNHMGSRFTRSEAKMGILLSELKERGLFYVDSRTTNRTVALDVARRLGVAAAERSVFLDNELTHEAMSFQLQRLLAIGRHSGKAVGIAHPHPETVRFLRKSLPLLKAEAEVVRVSEIVE
jgi:polysaccharide deacetylase 2 family uncharacterized protein YibQ